MDESSAIPFAIAKKPGPKRKPLAERDPNSYRQQPIRRLERSYTERRKIEVLIFLLFHRITEYRPDRPKKIPRARLNMPDS